MCTLIKNRSDITSDISETKRKRTGHAYITFIIVERIHKISQVELKK